MLLKHMSSSNNSESSACDEIIYVLMEEDFLNGMMLDIIIKKIETFTKNIFLHYTPF